jgi:hypothetical protein
MNLTEIESLVARMTPGPWRVSDWIHTPTGYLGIGCDALEVHPVQPGAITIPDDAAGIVSLRNNAEALIECARLLREARPELLGLATPELCNAIDAALARVEGGQ